VDARPPAVQRGWCRAPRRRHRSAAVPAAATVAVTIEGRGWKGVRIAPPQQTATRRPRASGRSDMLCHVVPFSFTQILMYP